MTITIWCWEDEDPTREARNEANRDAYEHPEVDDDGEEEKEE